MKACRECCVVKSLGDFYRHPQMGDGYLNKCKVCVRLRIDRWRAENLEHVQEYDRQRGRQPHRKRKVKERAPIYRERKAIYLKRYNDSNKDKSRARSITRKAVQSGLLKVAPCLRCGFAFGVHGHHEDYSKPLDVTWLCVPCHGERHREINAERRAVRKAA